MGAGKRVDVKPDYELGGGPHGRLMDRLVVRGLCLRGFRDLLAGLKHYAETGEDIDRKAPDR